jgi:hypothetical protein
MDQVYLPMQDSPKYTQIWIFGLKTNHGNPKTELKNKRPRLDLGSILLVPPVSGFT